MEITQVQYDRFLKMAKTIAGESAEDILHDSLILIEGKKIDNIDSYIFMTMRNKFIDIKRQEKKKRIECEIEYHETKTPSIHYLNQVLLEIEKDGYGKEVAIFKEATFVSNMRKVATRIGKSYRFVNYKCKFVKDEIKRRYDNEQ